MGFIAEPLLIDHLFFCTSFLSRVMGCIMSTIRLMWSRHDLIHLGLARLERGPSALGRFPFFLSPSHPTDGL